MSDREVYIAKIDSLIRDLFDEYTGSIGEETTARDVPQWDSLSNIKFMVLVEQEFDIRFSTAEIQSFKNLGGLIDALIKRKG